ncbi:non-specific serine/threonine protein kinase [Ranunculus cassubicifolius]
MRTKFFKFVLSILLSCTYCHAANTIIQGQSIKDGQTLTSPTNEFALGFFSPKNSSNRYVGIWYNKISEQTVVWVANRNNPITNSSGVLAFRNDGNLEVLDGSGKSLWSSNISSVNDNSTITAFLMDSGNLVLSLNDKVYDPDAENALWQSFDDPTDTYLPGKKVWLIPKSRKDIFVSWKSESDPSQWV